MLHLEAMGKAGVRDPYFTAPMKRALYRDFQFIYNIYAEHIDPETMDSGPDVLFVCSRTYAHRPRQECSSMPRKPVRQGGGFPVIVAPADGPLRAEMVNRQVFWSSLTNLFVKTISSSSALRATSISPWLILSILSTWFGSSLRFQF